LEVHISAESNSLHRFQYSSDAISDRCLQRLLPSLLSAVAGAVDVISFVSLQLFTAHITGNLVVIAALLVRGGPPKMDQIIAIPVFIIAVAGVWIIAKMCGQSNSTLVRVLLLVHLLLLTCVLIYSVLNHPHAHPRGFAADIAAMIAVSAMACQFAFLRLAVPGAPSTAVMTGNLTSTVLSLLDTLSQREAMTRDARVRLQRSLELFIPFFLGCLAGAAAVSWLGDWAWSVPVVLAGIALISTKTKPLYSVTS
jgi:uncharacterized membrane protein YoaK (UPF0700 family)